MMIAKASGKTDSRATPPRISQVSLPSQIGAIEFMIAARSVSRREAVQHADAEVEAVEQDVKEHAEADDAGPDRHEVEKPPPMASTPPAASAGRTAPGVRLLQALDRRVADSFLARAGAHDAGHHDDAGREHDQVDRHVAEQRQQHVVPGQRRRHRLRRAHQAVDRPGLASDLRRGPAGQHGDEAEGRQSTGTDAGTSRELNRRPAHRSTSRGHDAQHEKPIPTMMRNAQNTTATGGRWSAGNSFSPLISPCSEWVRIRLPR